MSVRQEGRYTDHLADRVTERQNDSMVDSRAAKEPALVLVKSEISVACRYSSRYNGILVNLAR